MIRFIRNTYHFVLFFLCLTGCLTVLAKELRQNSVYAPRHNTPYPSAWVQTVGSGMLTRFGSFERRAIGNVLAERQWEEAKQMARTQYNKDTQDKLSFVLLARLDPTFREEEWQRIQKKGKPNSMDLFQRAVLILTRYRSHNRPFPKDGHEIEYDRYVRDTLHKEVSQLLKTVWQTDKDPMVAAMFLEMAYLFEKEEGKDLSLRLLFEIGGPELWQQYQRAKENDWKDPVPTVTGLSKQKLYNLSGILGYRWSVIFLNYNPSGKREHNFLGRWLNVIEKEMVGDDSNYYREVP